MDEIIEQVLQLFYSCYFPKPCIATSLPKIINRDITKEEWVKIYDFLREKEVPFGGCKKFFDRDCEGCEMAKLVE